MRRVVLALAALAALAVWTVADARAQGYGGAGRGGYGRAADSFSRAAAEVRSAHSRYNYNTHPRSFYNVPEYPRFYQPYYQPYYPPYYQPNVRHGYWEYGPGYGRW